MRIMDDLNFMVIIFFTFINIFQFSFLLSENNDEIIKHLSHIASRHFHGSKNDAMPYEKAKEIVDTPKLEMTCGSINDFAFRYLSEKGLTVRFILTLTLDEWNSYNNGHSMIEIWNGEKWLLWDLDLKNIFFKNGKQLNAMQLILYSDYEIIKFNYSDVFSESGLANMEKFNLDLITDEGMRQFYKRCVQVILIRQDGKFYFTCHEKDIDRIMSYPSSEPYVYVRPYAFMNTFYRKKE